MAIEGGYQFFKETLRVAKQKYLWDIYHYCLMPNHIHILAQIDDPLDLPKIMHYVILSYSRWYRYQTGYVGHVWQGRYKNPLINRESYLLECGRYIERNPVRAGLVNASEDYPWSSYRFYSHGSEDSLVTKDPSYDSFGFTDTERRRQYQTFVKLPLRASF